MDEEVTFSGRFFLFVPIWSKPFVGKICILTTYDIFCMYIYGMRNGKMTLNLKIEDRKGVILGLVVSFILFWTGILSPLYTDNFLVWVFCLVPFYGYVFLFDELSDNKMTSKVVSFSPIVVFLFSVLMIIFLMFFDESEFKRNVLLIMNVVNSITSISTFFVLRINNIFEGCHTSYYTTE